MYIYIYILYTYVCAQALEEDASSNKKELQTKIDRLTEALQVSCMCLCVSVCTYICICIQCIYMCLCVG